jgi:cell division protease FtsH
LGNVQQITILPHGQAGGFTHISEDKEDFVMAKDKFLKHVTMLLGGRASEELVLNDVSSGAQDDIRKANELVQGMVLKLGMGEKFGLRSDLRLEIKEMDGVAVKDIDTILNQCYDSAKSILNQNRRNLDSVAKKLVEVDTLTGVELKELIGG